MKLVTLLAFFGIFVSLSLRAESQQKTELLSLYSAVHRSLKRNPEFLGEIESIKISQAQMQRELSEFDWGLEALLRYEDREKPQNTREFVAVGGVQLPVIPNEFLRIKLNWTSWPKEEVSNRHDRRVWVTLFTIGKHLESDFE